MHQRTFILTAGVILLLIAIGHLSRVIFGWDAVIGGWAVPMWVSVVALLIAGYLGYEGLRLGEKTKGDQTKSL
jgi:hypothetical protein